MEISYWIFVFLILLVFLVSGSSSIDNFHQPFPIVEPDPGHTKLRLSREGLEAISRITTPISAVAVIGPYRSGKSFLLNQLLSLSCDEGFGVGHMRDTKTKGIWVWGTPLEVDIDGVRTSVFYLDTEGFESVGKSNVYDDRIFALATVMSSVLIYNLPETGQDIAFEPAKLLWLIQRDFLQGKSVKEMVDEALRHVPNSDGDKNIDQVNQIRDSLAVMGDNSTAFSLPQPHLMRTKLCDLKDDDLDPMYVKKRGQLKELVASIIRPKIVQGKYLNGKEFVSFLEQILDALNKGEIPSTGSLVEVFNKGILERCLKLYSERMGKLRLPMPEQSLQDAHERSREEAMKAFEEQHFGRHHAKKSADQLDEEMKEVFKNVIMTNEYQSTRLCEALYTQCEDRMDQLQVLRLPTMAKFDAGLQQCNQSFEQECVGPSKANYEQRIMKMLGKSRSLFIKEYNQRLFNWLVAFSLVMVVIGRFIIKFILVEMAAWILFIFLETYTRMFWSAESLYYNPVWHFIVSAWETIVYSPILDLDRWAIPIACMAALGILYCRCYGRRKHGSQWLLPLYNHQKGGSNRPRSD
ncbi:Guanylate-binding 5 [Gossypium arboreum]|uniref:Guanylate-binding 5 n=1 Tax=Gossypium arboreum TaxID=29729 RepID=A0A0B0PS63_GOSAR|nr:Guanylate-binding 5 [Gossypium arboreum]KHG26251.1 Guanylate-binding 5 [Gossypium arboreum]